MHLGLMPSLDALIRMRLIGGLRHDFTERVRGPVEERHKAACDRAAQTFAETLATSLHTIYLLHPKVFEQRWIQYRIMPGKRPRNKSRAGRSYELRVSAFESSVYPQVAYNRISMLVVLLSQRWKAVIVLSQASLRA